MAESSKKEGGLVQEERSDKSDKAHELSTRGVPVARVAKLSQQLLGRTGLTFRKLACIGIAYGVALVGGLLFSALSVPLAWLLGPLVLSLVATAINRPLERPAFLQLPMRALLGVAIGASFTPELLGRIGGLVGSLALLVPYTAAVTFAGTVFLERVAGFDRPTAFFSAAPGGLADMALMSGDAGADARKVTLVQASRVLMIVFIVPFWLQFVSGLAIGSAAPRSPPISQLTVIDAAVICALAWAGYQIATRIGLLAASMVGPLILSGLLHGLGFTTVKVPQEVLIAAQMTLGIMIGGYFIGVTLREFVTVLSWGIAFGAMLLLVAAAAAIGVSSVTGLDPTVVLLSYSPGGQNEMNLLALIIGIDAAVVALHHLLRVAMVVIGAQLVFRWHTSWGPSSGRK